MNYDDAINDWFDRAVGALNVAVSELSRQTHSAIVIATPYDTGRAKNSWNIVSGAVPDLSVHPALRDRINPATDAVLERAETGAVPFGSESAANAAAFAKQQSVAILSRPVVTISNDLAYILPLEAGTSPQSPAKAMFHDNAMRSVAEARQMGFKARLVEPSVVAGPVEPF